MPFRGEAQNCETVKFLLNPTDYEVGGTRSVATKSLFLAVRKGVGTVLMLVVGGLRGLNRRRRKISNLVLFDILHMVNVFDVGWKSFSQIRNKFHEFLRI